ncbi:nucleotidyltransferase-like protein [Brevibacillus sp. SYSU BS000544]|uniref:nucleotidyltransferase-like protein n=1 Tax=Brevibacillus sp. SYSU BS000544 TaxID=3416443 RepID=UPI003CE4A7F6
MTWSLHDYFERVSQHETVLTVLLIDQKKACSFNLDGADLVYLVIVNKAERNWETNYYLHGDIKVVEHRLHQWHFEKLVMQIGNHMLFSMLQNAQIISDRLAYWENNRDRLTKLPYPIQKKFVCMEYSSFLRYYFEAKEFLQRGYALEAYQAVLNALNSWSRLVVYEAKQHPGPFLWNQVKQIDSTVYKLYEELVESSESLEKRIELLLLPIEFHIMSKMKDATAHVTDLMKTRNGPWSFRELLDHPEIGLGEEELTLLLDKMVKRSFIRVIPLKQVADVLVEQGFVAHE